MAIPALISRRHSQFFCSLGLLLIAFAPWLIRAEEQPEAQTPGQVIDFLSEDARKALVPHLNPKRSLVSEPDEAFVFGDDGRLQVTGKGWGFLRTREAYRDYRLVLEYQWGEHTWGDRADKARDAGVFVHGFGRDGVFAGSWINGFEVQLIEGGSGNLNVLAWQDRGQDAPGTRLSAEVIPSADGKLFRWRNPSQAADHETLTFPPEGSRSARVSWFGWSSDWTDIKGIMSDPVVESPPGEWNRLEVKCEGDRISVFLNGSPVNGALKLNPTAGFVALQSEFAEYRVRRWELWPIGEFKETWEPDAASTDTGYSASGETILPRRLPLSPEASGKAWEIDGDYEMQLVAAEPLTCDPVDVVWDARGRMFVAEMRDYPLPTEDGPLLSRIRLLKDLDGDGRMDEAVTWADELDHVQGLLPLRDGILATSRTAILFLRDTDGDDRADEITPLYVSNEPRHNQLQVSCPRWGLDNAVYLNNGLDGKEIYPVEDPEDKLAFTRLNLRYDPRSRTMTALSGGGQFGGSLDDWGRRFFCSNRNPAMFAVMPLEAVKRNPFAGITLGHEDIQEPGARVWPINLSHTTSVAHAGTHTAACGLGVYRGGLAPDLEGDLFVCDPTAQLVTRNRLVPRGGSFEAERVGEKRDFLVSADEWVRPVNVRNGPDGALYVCDMYRRFIDHSRFFPEEFSQTNYMRAGFDHGRIWRLVPKGTPPAAIEPLPADRPAELVKLLASPHAWVRIHAQRLLVETGAASVVPSVASLLTGSDSPQGRVHALWTLEGLGALKREHVAAALEDSDPRVVESAIRLSESGEFQDRLMAIATGEPNRAAFLAVLALGEASVEIREQAGIGALASGGVDDPWMRKAVLTSADPPTAAIVQTLLDRADRPDRLPGSSTVSATNDLLREFAAEIAARGDLVGMALLAERLDPEERGAFDIPLVEGMGQGLRRSRLATKSLAALMAKPPAEISAGQLDGVAAVLAEAKSLALDRERPAAERIGALGLVRQQGMEACLPVVEALIDPAETPDIQAAACQALSRFDRNQVADFFFERWEHLAPTPRREALSLIAGNPSSGLRLMKKMKEGEISPSLMPPMQRWSYARSSNEELKALAIDLFGQASGDRAEVIKRYQLALNQHEGDPERGKVVFEKAACMTCHEVGGVGVVVGPALADVRAKPAEALLSDILDPNRAVEERWAAYSIGTRDGRQLAGLVAAETDAAIEVRLPGGFTETVPREQVATFETSGLSLMPVGLESAITEAEMADLIAFLKAR